MWTTTAARFSAVLEKGRDGEIYNIGGNRSLPNKTVVDRFSQATGKPDSLIRYVTDRPGHDRRYALSSAKIMRETGWTPEMDFEAAWPPPWIGIAPTRTGCSASSQANTKLLRAQLRPPLRVTRLRPWFRSSGSRLSS